MKDSYIFYSSFDVALRELSDKSRLKVYDAISDYALRGIETDLNGMEKAIFVLIKTQIDRHNKRVEIGKKTSKKNRVNPELTQGYPQVNPKLTPSKPQVNSFQKEEVFPNEKERSKEKDNTLEEDKFERKKEKDIYINNNQSACACVEDFSKMTDEELIAWGEGRSVCFDNAEDVDSLYAWNEEMEKRANETAKWSGKFVVRDGGLERLKSHAEIMTEFDVSNLYRETLKEFLRHCYANRHLVTNEKLTDIILRLDEACGDDDAAKCEYIRRAISGGYFDVRA